MSNTSLPSGSTADHDLAELGRRIQSVRKRLGLTLVEASERSGVSRAALSKIERGELSPTITTLRKIAVGLDLTVANLVMTASSPPSDLFEVVRGTNGDHLHTPHYAYRALAGNRSDRSVRCFVSEVLSASASAFEELHTHHTEDVMFVLEGDIVAHFDGKDPVTLGVGDSIFFSGAVPHAFTSACPDGAPAKALWISQAIDVGLG